MNIIIYYSTINFQTFKKLISHGVLVLACGADVEDCLGFEDNM